MNHTYFAFLITAVVFIFGSVICNNKLSTAEDLKYTCTYLKQNMCVIKGSEKDSLKTTDISHIDQSKFLVGQQVVYKLETPQQQYQSSMSLLLIVSLILFVILRFAHYIFKIDFLHGIDF